MPRHSGSSYPTPDSTQPQTINSQPNTLQSSQSSTNQIADSLLSDVTQGVYSDFSTLDNLSANPAVQDSSDLTPHTPESLLYSPSPDVSLGNDPNSRKQRDQPPILRRSPRKLNNQAPQQSDSASLRSQESTNNQHVNQNSSSEKSTFPRMEIDRENRDINELRDLINKSNMILDSVHQSQEVDDQMRDIEYLRERQKANAISKKSLIHPHGVAKLGLERERGNENGLRSVDLVIANEISNTLVRQSEHFDKMASKFSNLKFIKIEPESEDEFATPIAPGIRRSSRKRTTANYSYPRYSYGGNSKRSKSRKRSRSFRKVSLSVPRHVDFKVDNERNKETDEPMHEFPVQNDEEFANDIQDDVDKNIFDNESQGNLYLKHDLRSRKIMLELLEGANENDENEETEEPVAATSSNKAVRPKRPVKRSGTLKQTSKKSAKTKPKRKTPRKSITRKKIKEHPNEVANEEDNDGEVLVTSTSRGTRSAAKPKRKTTRRSTSRKKNEDLEWHPVDEVDESGNDNEAEVVTPITSTPKSTRSKRKTTRRSTSRKKNEDLEWHPDNEVDESDNDNEANEAELVTPITSTPQSARSKRKTTRRSTSRKKNEDLEWHPDNEVDESDNDNEAEVVTSITSTPQSARSKRKTSRQSTFRKKNEDPEWHPNDEVEGESDDDNVVLVAPVTPTPRSTRSASKTTTTPKMATTKESVESMDITPEDRTIRKPSSKKATPKTPKTPKITRKVRKPVRVRGRGKVRGSRSKNRDTGYKYSGEEETESEIEIAANSENQIVRESSDVEMDVIQDIEPNDGAVEEPVPTPTRPKRTRKNVKDLISEPVVSIPRSSRSTKGRGGGKRGGRKGINTPVNDDLDNDVSSIHESSDKEETNVPDVHPQKTTRSARGGKGKGRGGHVGGNTTINQPPVPTIDPDIVEISAGNPMALANAVRALAEQNYDIVHSPENIVDINSFEEPRVPGVFIKPHNLATRSTSLNSTPPPELQTKSLHTSSILSWSNDHWHHLKIFYEETKNEFISSGKVVNGNEDVYREVAKKFFDVDTNNRIFGEDNLRMRIIALESADIEKGNEPSGSIQRRSSIGSNSSRSSRFSVSRYNKAYSNLRDGASGTKRKRSESNVATTEDNKKDKNEEYDDETEDKVSKRLRVEEDVPSEASAASEMNIPRSDSMLSKIFGGWFSGGQSQSNTASSNEETSRESTNNAENIMEHDGELPNSIPARSGSWWY